MATQAVPGPAHDIQLAVDAGVDDKLLPVDAPRCLGPGRYCSPRRRAQFEPLSLESNAIPRRRHTWRGATSSNVTPYHPTHVDPSSSEFNATPRRCHPITWRATCCRPCRRLDQLLAGLFEEDEILWVQLCLGRRRRGVGGRASGGVGRSGGGGIGSASGLIRRGRLRCDLRHGLHLLGAVGRGVL